MASPNNLHKEPVIKAAQNGKNVFCEKPIALSYEDCKEMVETCKENGVIFMAGHIMNFFNGVHHAKELINQGVIGDVFILSYSEKWLGRNNNHPFHGKKFVKNQGAIFPPYP